MHKKINLYRKLSSSISLGAISLLVLSTPAWGEGSEQLGSGDQGLNVYLFEYDATNSFIQGTNRGIKVNVESAGQIINVSLCGWSSGDDLAIEVLRPTNTEINYTTQVVAGSPGSFSSTAGSNNGAWFLPQGNARTLTQATLCNNQSNPNRAVGDLTTPVRFIAPEAGTYEIRLYNDSQASTNSNNVFTYFDITVTSLPSINPNPQANNGQVWATSWAFNAGNTFGISGGYDADLYIRTPGGIPNTEFIWQLDLNNFAPQRHEIIANSIGLNAPNSRASALGSSGASYNRDFPIYLSPPNPTSTVLPILPEPPSPNVTNFRFIDNADQDNTFSPNTTTNVQDSGFFKFNSDVGGTYKITVDTNLNGTFDSGDRVLFGSATVGSNSIQWDGRGVDNAVLPSGIYKAEITVGLGEYHFVTFDAETSGGGTNDGLSIWKWNGSSSRTPVLNYWDDTKISGGSRNLIGALSNTPAGKHTWGSFASGGIGDTNFIDTWVFASNSPTETQAIIASTDDNDFGDAPDTYGTNKDITVGGTPASHLINPSLQLGTLTDSDTDGQPSANADGDDINGTTPDDEEGVASFNPLTVNTTSYSTTVTVKNTTGNDAYLAGWIDFNRDGTFQDSEGAVATVANNSTTATLTWTNLSGLVAGNTYARFRISSTPLTTSQFIGGGSDGEVEDYAVTIALPTTLPPRSCANGTGIFDWSALTWPNGSLGPQQFTVNGVQYTVEVKNPNNHSFTDASPKIDRNNFNQPALYYRPNMTAATLGQYIEIHITMRDPATGNLLPITGLQGIVDDIDQQVTGGTWQDEVVLTGYIGGTSGTAFLPTLVAFNPANVRVVGNVATGITTSNFPTGGGHGADVEYGFGNQAIDTLVVRYRPGPNLANHTSAQHTTLNSWSFCAPPPPVANNPNVLLVKRITAVNGVTINDGINLATYDPDPTSPYDDNVIEPATTPADTDKWPATVGETSSNFLLGARFAGSVKPNDEIEYTIYFLSAGDTNAYDVQLCDRVPAHQTFVPDAFNSTNSAPNGGIGANRGILVSFNGSSASHTNDADGDLAQFYPPNTTLPTACDDTSPQNNQDGAVVVNLGDLPKAMSAGTPLNSFGSIRFRAKVK